MRHSPLAADPDVHADGLDGHQGVFRRLRVARRLEPALGGAAFDRAEGGRGLLPRGHVDHRQWQARNT